MNVSQYEDSKDPTNEGICMTSRTSKSVRRPANPTKSARAVSGNAAAESRLTTFADRVATTGRSVLIHAVAGQGKTVLAIHKAPRPTLVLDCDNGLDSVIGTDDMEDIILWEPRNRVDFDWEDLDEFRNYVKAGDWRHDYQAIVVDNTTAAQKPVIRSVIDDMIEAAMRKASEDHKEDDDHKIDPDNPSKQGWGKIYRRLDRWITDIRDAKRRGPHVIFTAGTSEWMDTAEGYTRMMPDIEGKERNQISTHFDAVMWLEADDEGRRLYVAPSGAYITKVRLPIARHDQVPDVIENPDFNSMIAATELEGGSKTAGPKKVRRTHEKSSSARSTFIPPTKIAVLLRFLGLRVKIAP